MLKRLSGLSKSALDKTRSLGRKARDAASPSGGRSMVRAHIVPREEHPVSRNAFSNAALKVLKKLDEAGYASYLVGGGVRDALVGLSPKDFDVATDASPEEVKALFRNARIIGRRFRLVHVVFGREIIEVATFRAAHDKGEGGETGASGRIVRDNVFGSIEEDALRRDFSVNALYYNISDRTVVDFVDGLSDIDARLFRLIGNPLTRCEEDPVRVLRAVRLAAKLEFDIHADTLTAMRQVAPELSHTPPARLFDEVLKLFQGGYAERSFTAVVDHDLLQYLFPLLAKRLRSDEPELRQLLNAALSNTDRRVAQGKPITPAYLLAFMLWADIEERALKLSTTGVPIHDALREAADKVMSVQLKVISIPRRFSGPMKEIWQMQPRLERYRGGRALRLMADRRFRAAYDFLCLRATIDPRLADVARWWTDVQNQPEDAREDAAANRPVAMAIWGARGQDAELPEDFKEDDGSGPNARRGRRDGGRGRGASGGRSSRRPGNAAPPDAAGASGPRAEADAPRKRRRRRRRKPGGDKSRTGNGSPPAS